MSKRQKPVSYDDIRKHVVEKVLEKYKMTATEFSESKHCKRLKIPGGSVLRSYLSGSSISFPVIEKLANDVDVDVSKKTLVERKTYYYCDAVVKDAA